MLDAGAAAQVAYDVIKKLLEQLQKPKPDQTVSLALISQLQQHIDQLRAENLQLGQQLLKAERDNFELQKTQQQSQDWERTKSLYELKEVYPGTRLYVPKDGSPRRLCQKCFERDHKEITLQDGAGGDCYARCRNCNATYQVSSSDYSTPESTSWMAA